MPLIERWDANGFPSALALGGMYQKMAQDIKRGKVFEDYIEGALPHKGDYGVIYEANGGFALKRGTGLKEYGWLLLRFRVLRGVRNWDVTRKMKDFCLFTYGLKYTRAAAKIFIKTPDFAKRFAIPPTAAPEALPIGINWLGLGGRHQAITTMMDFT
jgi:hypothetical protein